MYTPVSERIREELSRLGYSRGEANACEIYKGWAYGSGIEAYAWWVVPFGENAIYYGQSWAEAQDIIAEKVACNEQ